MIYFISDIHLNPGSPEITTKLTQFLRGPALQAEALYIIGDLFAIWLGDDVPHDFAQPVLAALNDLNKAQIPIYFIPGNRDFLVNSEFCTTNGMQLLSDPFIANLYGNRILITHGDLLCTLDHQYQRFRKFVQHPLVKKLFLALPKRLRLNIGTWIRDKVKHTSRKYNDSAQYDADPEQVNQWFNLYHTNTIIHGHTHKPGLHSCLKNKRIVLGDWTENLAIILQLQNNDFELINAYDL